MAYKRCEVTLALALLIIAGLACRALPLAIGAWDPDAYYHERLVAQTINSGLPAFDELSWGGREYSYYPLAHFAPAAVAVLLGVNARGAIMVVNALFALAGLLAVYALAKKWLGCEAAFWALAAAALLPAFAARGSLLARPEALAFALAPAALLLMGNRAALFALFFFGALYHLPTTLGVLLILLLVNALERRIAWGALGGAMTGVVVYGRTGALVEAASAQLFRLSSESLPFDFVQLLFLTGAVLVFAFAGWRALADGRIALWCLIALAAALFAGRNVVLLAPPLALLAGAGVVEAKKKARAYSGVIAPLFIIAAAASFLLFASWVTPAFLPQDFRAAEWAGDRGVVASWWDRGHLLAFCGAPVVADGFFEGAPDVKARIAALDFLMATGSEDALVGLNASLVFIDSRAGFYSNTLECVFDSGARVFTKRD